MNNWLAIIICLAVGILVGVIQGYWIAYLRIPAFIVTLAGMLLWKGVALIVLQGLTISPFPNNYLNLFNSYVPDPFNGSINIIILWLALSYVDLYCSGSCIKNEQKEEGLSAGLRCFRSIPDHCNLCGSIGIFLSLANHKGIPSILILLAIIVFAYTYYTTKTVPGRYLYAMGGNEKAAKLSGINTNKVLFFTYVNMAFLSSVAALVCVARFNSAAPTAGVNYEMDAIAACYIGGASAYGGIGSVPRVVIGAIFMGVINNGMSIMGIDSNVQKVVKGAVLLAAVTFDVLSKKKGK
jgi:putative multiple sugar transport system permease protein